MLCNNWYYAFGLENVGKEINTIMLPRYIKK